MAYPPADQPLQLTTQDGILLEAREVRPTTPKGTLLACHPHTLMGGTLDSKVVHSLYLAFRDHGFHALRFNFRGAGGSGGSYDRGQAELLDVAAAWHHLREDPKDATLDKPRVPRSPPRVLGGFSFGSHVGLRFAASEGSCTHRVGIAPPLSFDYDYSFLEDASDQRPLYLVVGDDDPFCPQDLVKRLVSNLRSLKIPVQATIIPGANHMFDQKGYVLRQELSRIAAEISGQEPQLQKHATARL